MADIKTYLGWINNEAVFDDAPLRELLSQLERWYGLSFVLDNEALMDERLTVHIESEPVDDILELIAVLTELQYERTGDSVFFRSRRIN